MTLDNVRHLVHVKMRHVHRERTVLRTELFLRPVLVVLLLVWCVRSSLQIARAGGVLQGAWVRGGLGALDGHPGAVPERAGPPRSLWAERVTSLPPSFRGSRPGFPPTQPAPEPHRASVSSAPCPPAPAPGGTHRRAALVNELLTHHTSYRLPAAMRLRV